MPSLLTNALSITPRQHVRIIISRSTKCILLFTQAPSLLYYRVLPHTVQDLRTHVPLTVEYVHGAPGKHMESLPLRVLVAR
jgi:hypothetical protein